MKQVELQIWNRVQEAFVAVDIDRSTQFPFVLESSDIQDPTAIKVEWSKQVTLPMTKLNNHLFSQIWKMDSLIYNFDPLLRTDFRLYINGDLFQSGYVKLESITNVYNIRLFGGLAEYFYILSERKLKDIAWNKKFDHHINRNLVYNAWNKLEFKNENDENMLPFFGYAMTYQGNYENFDENSVVIAEKKQEVTWIDTGNPASPPYGKTSLNEHKRTFRIGTTPYYGEYRSYYQKPMVRVQTILEKIFSDIKEEGWKTELDKSFFNSKNPYYNDLWMICPQYNIADAAITEYGQFNEETGIIIRDRSEAPYKPISFSRSDGQTEELNIIKTDKLNFKTESRKLLVKIRVPFRIKCYPNGEDGYNRYYKFTTNPEEYEHKKKMTVHIRGVEVGKENDLNSHVYFQNPETGEDYYDLTCHTVHEFHPWHEEYLRPEGNTYEGKKGDGLKGGDGTIFYLEANFPYNAEKNYELKLETCVQYYNSNWKESGLHRTSNNKGGYEKFIFELELVKDTQSIEIFAPQDLRTESLITWTDIMRSEYTYFDFLTSYSKVFGLLYTKNKYNKTVTIQTRNSFFAAQQRADWTNKLDHSKEKTIIPLGFDYKIGEFKWAELNTKYEDDYLNRNARHYGSMRFNNGYYYTNEEKNFLEGNIFNNCIIATDYSQYYLRRNDDFPLKDNKILPFLQDASESAVDTNLTLVFFKGYKEVPPAYPFLITDDNGVMTGDGYCWNTMTDESIKCWQYPDLSRYFQTHDETAKSTIVSSLNFGRPSLAYNDDEYEYLSDDDSDGPETIYSKFWKAYLMDRFDRNCKILTAYFHLTLDDVNSDLLNKFIYINDTVWVINKIIDFNPLNNEPTKVELVKVQNPDNYIGQNYIEGMFKMYYPSTKILNSKGNIIKIEEPFNQHNFTVYINSTLDWEIKDDDNLQISKKTGTGTEIDSVRDPVTFTLLRNISDDYKHYYIPFQWGSRVTMLEIKQRNGWEVKVKGINGLVNINNGTYASEISEFIEHGQTVLLNTSPSRSGYSFAYWKRNENYYLGSKGPLSFTVEEKNEVEAHFLEIKDKILVIREDAEKMTHLKLQNDENEIEIIEEHFWLLEAGKQYTLFNNSENITGFQIDNSYLITPYWALGGTFQTTSNTSEIKAFYNTFLASIVVLNNSNQTFKGSSIKIAPVNQQYRALPSPDISVEPGNNILTHPYSAATVTYGDYKIEVDNPLATIQVTQRPNTISGQSVIFPYYPRQTSITNILITIGKIGWKNSILTPSLDATMATNTLEIPENATFTIASVNGLTISPMSGTGTKTITFTLTPTTSRRDYRITATINYNGTTYTDSFTITQTGNVHIRITDRRGSNSTHLGQIVIQANSRNTITPKFLTVPFTGSGIYEGYFNLDPGIYTFQLDTLAVIPLPDNIFLDPQIIQQTIDTTLGDTINFSIINGPQIG